MKESLGEMLEQITRGEKGAVPKPTAQFSIGTHLEKAAFLFYSILFLISLSPLCFLMGKIEISVVVKIGFSNLNLLYFFLQNKHRKLGL